MQKVQERKEHTYVQTYVCVYVCMFMYVCVCVVTGKRCLIK